MGVFLFVRFVSVAITYLFAVPIHSFNKGRVLPPEPINFITTFSFIEPCNKTKRLFRSTFTSFFDNTVAW